MKIVVYTCILNGFDNLHPPLLEALRDSEARYICFTDNPHAPSVPPWEYRPAYIPFDNMGRNSRIPKILPHLFFDADYSIWHDGCFALKMRPEDIVGSLGAHEIAAHRHPARKCLFEEAELCIAEKIGDAGEISRQAKLYELLGHPKGSGLWANGLIVRKHSAAINDFNEGWWLAYRDGCSRDQISFPFVLRNSGIQIQTLGWNPWASPLMEFYWHDAFKGRGDVDSFAAENEAMKAKMDRLREVAGDDKKIRL